MKKFVAAALSLAAAATVAAGPSVPMKSVSDFIGQTRLLKSTENGFRFTSSRYFSVETRGRIPVDPAKKYRISFEYRLAPGSKPVPNFYLGPTGFDAKGTKIAGAAQNVLAGSDTTLAEAAKAGDTVIKIKNGSKWSVKWGFAAFNTKPDLSDLPNSDIVSIKAVEKTGDVWSVTLARPLGKDYAAGTNVRNQRASASYRYVVYGKVPAEWTKVDAVIQGCARESAPGYIRKWRLGTTQAGLTFFTQADGGDVEIRNLVLEEIE